MNRENLHEHQLVLEVKSPLWRTLEPIVINTSILQPSWQTYKHKPKKMSMHITKENKMLIINT